MNGKQTGVTLIELVVCVAIIGILAGIAVPSYQGYLRKAACEQGKAGLIALGSAMERYRARHGTFMGAELPGIYPEQIPEGAARKQFQLAIESTTPYTWRVSAMAMPGTFWNEGFAGRLLLDSSGQKSAEASLKGAWDKCPA